MWNEPDASQTLIPSALVALVPDIGDAGQPLRDARHGLWWIRGVSSQRNVDADEQRATQQMQRSCRSGAHIGSAPRAPSSRLQSEAV